MKKYKVVMLENEYELEDVLNEYAGEGWVFNSLETEYKMGIIIFERETWDTTKQET